MGLLDVGWLSMVHEVYDGQTRPPNQRLRFEDRGLVEQFGPPAGSAQTEYRNISLESHPMFRTRPDLQFQLPCPTLSAS